LSDLISRIETWIVSDDLEEAASAISNLAKATTPGLAREALLHQGRLASLRRRTRIDGISTVDALKSRAQIAHALLELLDDVKARLQSADRPFATGDVTFPFPRGSQREVLLDGRALRTVAWLQRAINASASVCRIRTPNGLGTGFVAGDGWLFTNNHVLPSAEVASNSTAEFDFEEDADGSMKAVKSAKLEPSGFKTSATLDYSLVKLAQPVIARAIDTAKLSRTSEVELGAHVVIIQHPSGGPKQIAFTANQIVNVYRNVVHYTTDTMPGSSGSPVFDDDWNVVAIHRAGGNLLKNDQGDRLYANEGVLIAHVLTHAEVVLSS
jgi:V8-like Glu-specific endopeptidase